MFLYKCWRERIREIGEIRVGDKINHLCGIDYRPPLSPPKNPIKREKKKLVCSSEREDFIKSGEDWFVRLLRVL